MLRHETAAVMHPNNASVCVPNQASIMLEELIQFHGFTSASPDKAFTEASRQRKAMVATD